MQTPPKNTSAIIKQTLDAKRKSRHRLIGSIFLLVIALIILLNITAKVKPNSTPIKINIKNTSAESNPITFAENTLNTVTESNMQNVISNNTTNIQESIVNIQPIYQAQVINRDGKKEVTTPKLPINDVTPNNTTKPTNASPKLINEKSKNSTPDPLDILNDIVDKKPSKSTTNESTNNGKFYIQLASVSHKENVLKLQNELNSKGVQTFIQEISTAKGTMYRLRVGPFGDKITAEQKLSDLKNQGQSAIITGN